MKRNEITAGVALAYARYNSTHPTPVVVIDTETLWTRLMSANAFTYTRSTATRCSSDRFYRHSTGYLMLKPSFLEGDTDGTQAKRLVSVAQSLPKLNADSVNELDNGGLPKGVQLSVADSRHLLGEWHAATAAFRAREVEAEEHRRNEMDRAQRETMFLHAVRDALEARELGREVYRASNDGRVEVKLSVLAELLGVEQLTVDE